MLNIISTIKKLPEMTHDLPANKEAIKKAEDELNLIFADEYKEYLLTFGAVKSDIIAISGITKDEEYDVVKLTKKLKLYYTNISSDFYVIEDVGVDGLVIWQDSNGTIYQSIPNHEPAKVFDNLSAFLNYQMED